MYPPAVGIAHPPIPAAARSRPPIRAVHRNRPGTGPAAPKTQMSPPPPSRRRCRTWRPR
ncbi:hypothetical protein I553_0467 [Mycobacterium xenopi 4042]|uniref:Uncharacterized protein n=1 Tax=Mycobacterium xenopi 4042 TaxID=1299334 RepID=X7YJL1_MYCXE|nr:hypothetical protein I553_0467 [Mycobacterium xenopi 4042]